jgi:predicted phage terminase large subunit-like protein
MTTKSTGTGAETGDLANTILNLRALRQETVRREILDEGRIDLLASHALRYEVRPFHLAMLQFQSEAEDTCLQLAPRGYGKSTILTITRAVFEIIRNPNIRILIASNTQLQSEVFLREIKFHLEHNPRVREYFGSFASDDKWDIREIVVAPRTSSAKESTITCVGVGGPVASRHYDIIIADDLVDEENSRTEIQRDKVKTWWYKTLVPCCEPDGKIYVLGTRYHYLDLYGHLIKSEYADKHQVIPAIYPDGSTPWPEKFSPEWLEKKKEQMGSIIFNSQYQNDTSLMKGHIFKEEWFRYYDKEPDWDSMSFFVGCDPAATKRDSVLSSQSANTDWWTIVVGAREVDDDRDCKSDIYLKEVWRGRCTKEEYLTKLREVNEHYQPVSVVIETVAAQEYLAQDAERFMPVRRVNRTTDKVARAYWLQAFFENGQILFPAKSMASPYADWQALIDELLLFPQAEHDDLFDGLQTMVEGAMKYGSGPRITLLG